MAVDSRGSGGEVLVGESKVNLSAKKYFAIKIVVDAVTSLAHDFMVDLAVAGDKVDGYITEEVVANKGVHFDAVGRRVIGVAGEAIGTPGIELVSNAAGKLIAVANGTLGDAIVGISLTIASGDGSRFSILSRDRGAK